MTSLVFMFDDVPEPVWKTSIGNWSSCSPAATSSAACRDLRRELRVDQPELAVDARRGALDAPEPVDHGDRDGLAGDREVVDGLLRLAAVERVSWPWRNLTRTSRQFSCRCPLEPSMPTMRASPAAPPSRRLLATRPLPRASSAARTRRPAPTTRSRTSRSPGSACGGTLVSPELGAQRRALRLAHGRDHRDADRLAAGRPSRSRSARPHRRGRRPAAPPSTASCVRRPTSRRAATTSRCCTSRRPRRRRPVRVAGARGGDIWKPGRDRRRSPASAITARGRRRARDACRWRRCRSSPTRPARRPIRRLREPDAALRRLSAGRDRHLPGRLGRAAVLAHGAGALKLVGVTSYGDGCARPGRYGIYARVADTTLREWIRGLAPAAVSDQKGAGRGAREGQGLPCGAALSRRTRSARARRRPGRRRRSGSRSAAARAAARRAAGRASPRRWRAGAAGPRRPTAAASGRRARE